jgi:hypothetical protein
VVSQSLHGVTLIQSLARLCCHIDCLLFVRRRRPIPRSLVLSWAPGAAPRRARGSSRRQRTVVTPYFNDWKRFCAVLREIASGEHDRPLSGLEAQMRAQAVLNECGYTWLRRTEARESIAAAPESSNTPAPVDPQSPAGTQPKKRR